jgi:hypothetical protein
MNTPKRQIRKCAVCQKVGHNKTTCPNQKTDSPISNKTTLPPLKFFVHHVNFETKPSNHVVNLKERDIWQEVEATTPKQNFQTYQNYHKQQKNTTTPSPLNNYRQNPINEFANAKTNEIIKSFAGEITETIRETNSKTTTSNISNFNFKPQTSKLNELINNLRIKLSDLADNIAQNFKQTAFGTKKIISLNIKEACGNIQNWFNKYFPLRRTVASAVLFSIIIFAPSHAQTYYQNLMTTADTVAISGTAGFSALKESTASILSGDINNARLSLSQALQNFNSAVETLNGKHHWILSAISALPIIGDEVQSRENLITAGRKISQGNSELLNIYTELQNAASSTLTDNIELVSNRLQVAIPYYRQALAKLNDVNPKVLPSNYQSSFNDFKLLFSALVVDLENISQLGASMQEIFGGQGLRRYLVVFQNPHEIRATGGFIGSFAILDIKDGKILKMEVPPGGSYDVQGQLDKYVEPPAPLLLINNRWEFQDANWFPDFPASAEKLMWFYRHSRDITVDGVIAVNATVLNRILDITGPITDNKRNVTLSSTNALTTIQKIVESGPEKKELKPKQILTDLAPKFIDYFQNIQPSEALPVLINLQESLEQKEIQIYFTDKKTQNTITDFGWSGKITLPEDNQDYLFVVNSNINGQKSDAKIIQTVNHQAIIQDDGTILNTVTIARQHTGKKNELMYGAPNVNFIRIYVPQGSQLISAGGFVRPDEKYFRAPQKWCQKDLMLASVENEKTIDPLTGTRVVDEFSKTSFSNWIITQPGETSTVQFTYRLPFKTTTPSTETKNKFKQWYNVFKSEPPMSLYQLVVQKQSGIESNFDAQIIFPENWQPLWQSGENIKLASNGATVNSTKINKDKIWSLIMGKNE